MTTVVVVKAQGPADVVVDLMDCNPNSPKDPPSISSIALVQKGDEQEFVVHNARYLVIRERV